MKFEPGDKLQWIVGMPGPDVDDCEILAQEGDKVKIKFQVYGKGPFREDWISASLLRWKRGSEISARYHAQKLAFEAALPPSIIAREEHGKLDAR